MNKIKTTGRMYLILLCWAATLTCKAGVPDPGTPSPYIMLDQWGFHSTNWISDYGHAPVAYTNIANLTNILWIDTANTEPAYLFYKVIESSGPTNIVCSNGTISLWLNPDWSSTNQGGTGPGDWANLISLGEYGTNGSSSWWAWYFDPSGTNIYFSAQTNGTDAANYLAAPVTFVSGNWYNLVLTYTPTNSAFYTNGVLVTNGTGVTYWPGTDVTFFAMGSDSNGFHQSRSLFSYVQTYNYPLDSGTIAGNFGIMSILYGISSASSYGYTNSAPSTNSVFPTFSAVTGPGYLTNIYGASLNYPTNTNVWFTNYTAAVISSNVIYLNFAVAGGSSNTPYDVFATANLTKPPLSKATWYWMGQAYKGTIYTLPVTNLPPNGYCLVLGTPQDSDLDGLTDAYELLITHTSPTNAYSSGSGMLDGWSVIFGLNPLVDNSTNATMRLNYSYDPVGRFKQATGIRTETIGFDAEGNIQGDSQ